MIGVEITDYGAPPDFGDVAILTRACGVFPAEVECDVSRWGNPLFEYLDPLQFGYMFDGEVEASQDEMEDELWERLAGR